MRSWFCSWSLLKLLGFRVHPARWVLMFLQQLVSMLHGLCRSELLCERVVELLHGDLAVAVVVEASHERVLLVVGNEDIKAKHHKRVKYLKMEPLLNAARCNAGTYLRRPELNSSKEIEPLLSVSRRLSKSMA